MAVTSPALAAVTPIAATKYVDVHALRMVFVVALVAGIGITALFALAVRSLATPRDSGPSTAQRVLAAGCLAAVAAAVASGVWAVLAK